MRFTMKKINEATPEGFEMGYHLARWADNAEDEKPVASTRCSTCAFRQGTYPNGSPVTLMEAMKCLMEGVPFLCHEEMKTCSGYALLRRGTKHSTEMPWSFSDE